MGNEEREDTKIKNRQDLNKKTISPECRISFEMGSNTLIQNKRKSNKIMACKKGNKKGVW